MVPGMFRARSSPLASLFCRPAELTRLGLCLVVVGLVAACASPPPVQTAPPIRTLPRAEPARQPELAAFSARLTGQSTVPTSDSAAQGELVAVLNRNTGLLQWKLSFSGLSGPVRGANFHSPGMAGEVAQPVLSLGRSVLSPSEGRAMLSARQRADLLAGQWYINLRTARYPDGEIRGQMIEKH